MGEGKGGRNTFPHPMRGADDDLIYTPLKRYGSTLGESFPNSDMSGQSLGTVKTPGEIPDRLLFGAMPRGTTASPARTRPTGADREGTPKTCNT